MKGASLKAMICKTTDICEKTELNEWDQSIKLRLMSFDGVVNAGTP